MNPRHIKSIVRVVSVIMLLALMAGLTPGTVLPVFAAPGDTTCVSVNPGGTPGNDYSNHPDISPDGRYVVFEFVATNLVSGDPNGGIFVRDLQTSQTTRIPVDGENPVISNGGRYVAFTAWVIGETADESMSDVFVHDRQTSITTQVSVNSNEVPGNGWSDHSAISADGRYVAFGSEATNLVDGDTNEASDIFVRDLQTGTTERVSIASDGSQSNAGSWDVSISADGSIVVFTSSATNLVSRDTNGARDIFVRDRTAGTTTRASVNSSGVEASSGASDASVSGNGRFVSFSSGSSNLMVEDSLNFGHIYVHDRQTGTTNIASVASDGYQMIGNSEQSVISADGRYVAFVFDDKGDSMPIFVIEVHDRLTGSTSSVVGRYDWEAMSGSPSISADGRLITFSSGGALVSGDTNGVTDVYMKEMAYPPDLVPIVRSVEAPYDSYPTHANVSFLVTFSEIVTGVTVDDFSLTMGGGVSGATVTNVRRPGSTSPSLGNQYRVDVNTGTGNGTLRLDVIDNDSIQDVALNPLGGAGAGNGNFTAGGVFVVDKNIPAVIGVTRVDPNPTGSAVVNFAVTFSEDVSGVDALDFILTGSVSGAVIVEVTGSGKNYNIKVSTGSGEGTLGLNVIDDDSIRDVDNYPIGGDGTANGTFTHGEEYTINRSPRVLSSLRLDPNPTTADTVNFAVIFSDAVSGVDISDFATAITGTISGAAVANVSGAGTTYIVTVNIGAGDGTLRLDILDNDSIVNAMSIPLGGVGLGNGNYTAGDAYLLEKNAPVVISSLRADADPTNADSVHFNVTFSEAVSGVDTSDFALTTTGNISGATVTEVSGIGNTYIVTVNTGTGDGALRLDLIDNDSIMNAAANPLGGAGAGNGNFTLGETYTIDKNAPVVISNLRADANPTTADSVHFNVTFSDAVSGVDAGDFVLTTTGNLSGASITGLSGSANTYTITVATGSGNGTLRLDLIDNDSIVDSVNQPLGGLGAGNGSFTMGETYTINKISDHPC